MATKIEWTETEIEKLCKDVCHQIKEKNHSAVSGCLQKLRSICGGGKCECSAFTPAQKLSQMVEAQLARGGLFDTSAGLAIISNYDVLSYQPHCITALENLLGRVLKSEVTETEKDFLDRLWLCPGLREFKIELVSDFIHTESKYIEQDLLNIFESYSSDSVASETSFWDDFKFERIVYWSSKSAKIFCAISSILNSLVHQTLSSYEQFDVSEDIVSSFIVCVKNSCLKNNTDFVLLYPSDYHSLVTLMEIRPSLYLQNSSSILLKTVELFKDNLVRNPIQTLCLLSHFPEWTEYIDR